MNYCYVFYVGNFVDIFKYFVLVQCVEYFNVKFKFYCYIDMYFGIGGYDFVGDEVECLLEWKDGIGCLINVDLLDEVESLLVFYLGIVWDMNEGDILCYYFGLLEIVMWLMCEGDCFYLCEFYFQDSEMLDVCYKCDKWVKVEQCDGYKVFKLLVLLLEKCGFVLIDLLFEDKDELVYMVEVVMVVLDKWLIGIFVFWCLLKNFWVVDCFDNGLVEWLILEKQLVLEKILCVDLWI